MSLRLFFDANALFAATNSPQGSSRAILELSETRLCTVVSSAFALDETQRNVRAKRPADLETLKSIEALLQVVPEPDPVLVKWAGDHVRMKGAPILAAAVAANADVLVTGDRRHFDAFYGLTLKKVRILTPRDALEELLEMDAHTDPPQP